MDLGAYAQIADLAKIMEDNGISVPRLRGLRLMSQEQPYTKEELDEVINNTWLEDCDKACRSGFSFCPAWLEYSTRTRRIVKRYMVVVGHKPVGVRWDKIHGKKRKLFKYLLKQARRNIMKTCTVFNKYCGSKDVLYIHARIGGPNWPEYRNEIEGKPWFIEKVDDPYDSTYCDIYARIKG